jgi:putative hydrolase of the HAD superfamily
MRPYIEMAAPRFDVLYSDIGGVLGTNGWDSALRRDVCARFNLPAEEIDKRHLLMFDSYERGFMKFEDYLRWVFFAAPRPFALADLRDFILAASVPWPQNIALLHQVKKANGLKLGLISNEGQGITEHRMHKFGLRQVADFIVVSHCVHMRKPDRQIWQLALDLAQATPDRCIYVDDREMFVNVAATLGFTAFQHVDLESTRRKFEQLGLATT